MADPIERITLTHLEIPWKEATHRCGGVPDVKGAILVTVETALGIGLGESAPAPGGDADGLRTCWADLTERIAPALLGREVTSVEEIGRAAASVGGRGGIHSAALAGVETALWDLVGQARHATIAEMLGASVEQLARGVQSGLCVGQPPTIVELLETIETHLSAGYQRVKIAIAPGDDIERVLAVRQHFGDIPLMVDACGAYTRDDLEVFRALDDAELLMIIQPCAADDLEGLAAIQQALATPICLDATATTPERVNQAIDCGACRIVTLRIQRLGGLGPSVAVHDLCYAEGVACWVGTSPELGVGQAHGIHLAALANCKYPTDIESSRPMVR